MIEEKQENENQPILQVSDINEFLKGKTPQDIPEYMKTIQKRIKRMHYRSYIVDKEIRLQKEIKEGHTGTISKLEGELEDPKSNSDEIIRAKKHSLLAQIAEEEKNLIETELQVLDLPNLDGNEVLE